MSRLLVPPLPPTPPPQEETPFFGWRYLRRRDTEGREYLEEIPLTLEDVLYPQEGDEIVMRPQHRIECAYLANVLTTRFADDPSVAVLSYCLIDWGVVGQRNHEPDLALFHAVQIPPDPQAGTFDLRASGGRVVLTVEVVSPDSRANDVERKPVDYHRLGIPLYVLIDQQRKHGPRHLHGYRWTPSGYEEQPLDAGGRLLLESVGLLLALEDGWLACYDAATGERLGDYQEIAEALQEERTARRAAEEGQRQEAVARQAAEEQQRREAAARQAAEEQQRREAIARQAAEEQQRREAAARQAAEEQQRREAAARQAAEEQQRREAAARQAAEEQQRREAAARQAAEEQQRREAAARQAAEEQQRREAAARQAAEEQQRREAAARQAAEEQQRREAAARQAAEEQQRREAAARQAAEEQQRREAAARQAAEDRAATESVRAQAAEERLRQLEAELRRLRGDS